MEVTSYDKMEATHLDVAAFREDYPVCDDVARAGLAPLLHRKYFAELPLSTCHKAFLSTKEDGGGLGGGDPLGIRGSPFEAAET